MFSLIFLLLVPDSPVALSPAGPPSPALLSAPAPALHNPVRVSASSPSAPLSPPYRLPPPDLQQSECLLSHLHRCGG